MAQPRRPHARARRLTLVVLVAVVVVGGVPLRAHAALGSDGGVAVGNGRHNRNSVSINSPEFINRGIQHVTNTNVGGGNNTQASFCQKRFRHCRISQRQFFGW